MHKLKPESIASLLKNRNSVTNQYTEHAFQVLQLDQILKKLLPDPLNQHCQAANIKKTTLVMAVDSPVWSSRLRFHAPEIIKNIGNNYGYSFARIQILVHPVKNRKQIRKKPLPRLSPQSAELIRNTAQSISDPLLSKSLLRLSRRSGNK